MEKNRIEDLMPNPTSSFLIKLAGNITIKKTWHCRMRRQSSTLVMAANQNSAIDVLFGAESIGNIWILSFHRGTTLEFLKYFRTFYFLNFGQPNGVIIFFQPIRNRSRDCFFCLFTGLWLRSRAGSLLPLFTCDWWPSMPSMPMLFSYMMRARIAYA